jgi:hypothetical protein
MNTATDAPKNILIVTKGDLKAIEGWPLELRALFDPKADREFAERIERERAEAKSAATDEETPF